jgi:hypothetical protein
VGGLLVIACVLSFGYAAAHLGDRVPVLAVARPVTAGQVLTTADVTEVSTANDAALGLIPASQAGQVLNRAAVVPLVPGTLLTRAMLGDAAFPPAGQVVSSLALKPGQYPQGMPAGARVAVFITDVPSAGDASTSPSRAAVAEPARLSATVLGVDPAGDGQGGTLVTLLLAESDASRLAGAPAPGCGADANRCGG